jgi:hypothetical protein
VRAGDDGIAIKSGLNAAGRAFGMPCEHVTIRNVTVHPLLDNLSTNGVSIGSEMSGGVRNVSVHNVTVVGCAAGIYIKSMLGRGGCVAGIEQCGQRCNTCRSYVRDVSYSNVTLHRVLNPIKIVMRYSYNLPPPAPSNSSDVPVFDSIYISHVRATSCASAGDIYGLTDVSNITNLRLYDVTITGALADVVAWSQCEAAQGLTIGVSPAPPCLTPG